MADSPPPMDFEEEEPTVDTTETTAEPKTEEPAPAATLPMDSSEEAAVKPAPESSTALLEPTSTDDLPEEEVVNSKPDPSASAPPAPKSEVHDLFDDDEEPQATAQPQVRLVVSELE